LELKGGDGQRRCRGGRDSVEDNVIVADDDGVALVEDGVAVDAVSVDMDAVAAFQVLNKDLCTVAEQACVVAGDVALCQADGITAFAADGNFLTAEGDFGFSTFIVLDKEIQHVATLSYWFWVLLLLPSFSNCEAKGIA